ncbi:kynureninase [Pseudosulfitobacter pseudonitzschiae]|uniref:kynureninase n=1 Tax=Pseudosulfitobacter pseudonitzschiae TaxID=1402135 RepID=UPI001AFC514F|nr:kynureninase [Pseudosulfitobacter pseudonitzschiae]MBM1813640.1 kynureninase [Pseudosulfitobacter pseudonitzschiae]MBM1830633.1 kynureninase [Pseudosulfitobacter pseudonitzschiae]MBM1835500.1 kynureninase [Pseudosulfitobacter pseudonitzschiae]MBM1840346.1 kynureninase [Pseudosulfitobacter pseudonitzschiae]MBM1845666.1 kynureninase [Pseudosulfitobacter pseudonitzschiae]
MVLRKEMFDLPEGVLYLDGNSLGPLPKAAQARVSGMIADEWGQMLIRGWNEAGWMAQPARIGDKVGRLIGAPEGSVVMGDTLSIKVYQAVASALKMRPGRKVILSDTGNFPTDLYMVQGLINTLDQGYELKTVAPEDVAGAIDDTIAAVMLTEVDYRTGRKHDMKAITEIAHASGAVMIWDLAHSAGAVPVDLAGSNCEMAVGCTYKYLNGGPGAPAFIYVRPDLAGQVQPALAGWMGHDAPFDFDHDYRPAGGIERMRVGTPPIIQLAALEAAMEVWDGVDMAEVRKASIALQELFIKEVEARVPALTLASPRDAQQRGSQVSFRFEEGYAAMQALIARGVIGDFRAPDTMRFGFTPLYLDQEDVLAAVAHIETVMRDKLWDDPQYRKRSRVT